MQWYVAQVQGGKEEDVRRKLQFGHFEARIPRERRSVHRHGAWQSEDIILMPGYVFIGLDAMCDELYHRIRRVPDVIRLLGEPTPISRQEAAFWCLEGDQAPLEASILSLDASGRPCVLSGPLAGRERDIVWVNRRQRRAGVRMHTPEGLRIVKFSIEVRSAIPPPGNSAGTGEQDAADRAGSMHSPAKEAADIHVVPRSV